MEIKHPFLTSPLLIWRNSTAIPTHQAAVAATWSFSEIIWPTVPRVEPGQAQSLPPCTHAVKSRSGNRLSTKASSDPKFKGVIKEEATVGEFKAVVPQITGSAYVTGEATYVIDPDDPLKYGFKVARGE